MTKQKIVGILIGIPGSGKSTYAKVAAEDLSNRNDYDTVIISSDDIREELYGDASIQGNPVDVFNKFYKDAKFALGKGYNIILDATNVSKKDRKNIYNHFGDKYNYEAFVFLVNPELAKERNRCRERQVPDFVIDRMYKNFSFPYEEWIKIVHVINE